MAQQSQLTVKATLEEKDRVRLSFPYSYELVQKVKEVPGREYDLASMTWTIPAIHYRKFCQVNPWIQVEAESAEDKKA